MSPLKWVLAVLMLAATAAVAEEPPQDKLTPLDELLSTRISTAAKYDQNIGEVAASVTVITAEEIERYGWRTLAEVLGAVGGLYTSTDHAYTYLGVRGIGLPTDYNNRFLVLIDGTAMFDAFSGAIDVGSALAFDMSHVERIEFVRGPGSVIYGTGAMFGVINLITRDERERPSVAVTIGTDELHAATARAGAVFGELSLGAAASWQESNGGPLYAREFDTPETNGGIVNGRDYDDFESVLATARWKGIRLLTLQSSRTKGNPTGPLGTVFGEDSSMTIERSLSALSIARQLRPTLKISSSAFLDRSTFIGRYPLSIGRRSIIRTESKRTGAEIQAIWDVRPNHRLTAGASYQHGDVSYSANYRVPGRWPGGKLHDLGGYIQAESDLTPHISTTVGVSYDRHDELDPQITPRGALIVRPAPGSTLKLLYGRGFRHPSLYEREYSDNLSYLPSNAGAERIRTLEMVLDQRISDELLASASVFDIVADDLIRLEPAGGDRVQFRNAGSIKSRGVEIRFDYRHTSGIWSYISGSYQRATEGGDRIQNSPLSIMHIGLSTPTAARVFGAIEGGYEAGRITRSGAMTDGAALVNVRAALRITHDVQVAVTVRNAADADHPAPAGPLLAQNVLDGSGRTFLLTLKIGGR